MRSNLATWMKGKLDQINDRATSADWANMEEMLNAHPAFAPATKPWYKTNLGIGGLITAVIVVLGLSTWTVLSVEESNMEPSRPNDIATETQSEANQIPQLEDVTGTETGGPSPYEDAIVGSSLSDKNDDSSNRTEEVTESTSNDYSNASITIAVAQDAEPLNEVIPSDVTPASNEVAQNMPSSQSSLESQGKPIEIGGESTAAQAGAEISNPSTSDARSTDWASGIESNEGSNSSVPTNPTAMGVSGSGETANAVSNAGSDMVSNEASNDVSNKTSNLDGQSGSDEASMDSDNTTIAEVSKDESGADATPNASTPVDQSSAVPEDGASNSATPVIRSMRDENAIQFSLAAYGTYDLGGGEKSSEEGRSYEWSAPMGYGLEVEASWKGWTASSGVMYHDEVASYSASSFSTDTNRSAAYWYEADTQQVTIIDSTWVIQGINQGYWQVDTTVRSTINHELNERLQYSITTSASQTSYRWAGYRLSAPLLVGKRWDLGRFTTGVQAGPVFTFRSATLFTNESFQTNYTELGTDLLVRLEVGYRITNHFDLFGRASYRTNATANTLYGKSVWTQSQVPVSFGMRYRF